MNRKQKKKDAREQSTRQLMGIDDFTDYGIATRMGNLVFFAIKPTNISVLPGSGVGARIYALLNVIKGQAEIEMLALNSKESFENNKDFYRQQANLEDLPAIRKLLEQDSAHLDRIQVLMASSREFYIYLRMWRSIQVEGAFGLLKNDFGFRRFLTRGKANIRTELFFLALAYDLKKLWMKRENGRLKTHLSEIAVA